MGCKLGKLRITDNLNSSTKIIQPFLARLIGQKCKKVIFVSIKLVNNVPYFFIENDKLEFVFDKDSAALLMLLLNNYITNSSFQNFEEILKGDK